MDRAARTADAGRKGIIAEIENLRLSRRADLFREKEVLSAPG